MTDFSQLFCGTQIWGRNSVGKCKHWVCKKNDMRSNSEEVAMAGQPHNAEAAPARRDDPETNLPERNFSKEDCDNPQPMDQHKRRVPHDIYKDC